MTKVSGRVFDEVSSYSESESEQGDFLVLRVLFLVFGRVLDGHDRDLEVVSGIALW